MRADDFRRIALSLKDAVEGAHMGHPDFRIGGRIFATLRGDSKAGAVKLTPEDQQRFIQQYAAAFVPASGAWGREGWTSVQLDATDEETMGEALTLAAQSVAAKAARPSAKHRRPAGKRAERAVQSLKRR